MSRLREESREEPVKPTLLSEGRVKYPCKCSMQTPPKTTFHATELFSDGWTRLVCSKCGQVKFSFGFILEGK